jgi:hypothetical protein
MSYKKFAFSPKAMTEGGNIGYGEVDFSHLSPPLFMAIRNIELHSHSGVGSRRINLKDLYGYFGSAGFLMYSSDGTKKYQVTINSGTGAFVLTEV